MNNRRDVLNSPDQCRPAQKGGWQNQLIPKIVLSVLVTPLLEPALTISLFP